MKLDSVLVNGSLADNLIHRKVQVLKFRDSPHADVRQWADDSLPDLDRRIEFERGRDRDGEERFE